MAANKRTSGPPTSAPASPLERALLGTLRIVARSDRNTADWLSRIVPQHAVVAGRRWRFDFAWPDQRVAVEVQGGIYTGGRHGRAGGQAADCNKLTCAALAGWRVLLFSTADIQRRPLWVVDCLITLLDLAERERELTARTGDMARDEQLEIARRSVWQAQAERLAQTSGRPINPSPIRPQPKRGPRGSR